MNLNYTSCTRKGVSIFLAAITLLAFSPLLVAAQQPTASTSPGPSALSIDAAFYSDWRSPEELENKWRRLTMQHDPLVRMEKIGLSVEKRTIHALRVGKTDPLAPRRVLINALLHGREWVSTMAVTYAVEALVVNASTGGTGEGSVAEMLSQVQLLVVPVSNPDGFALSQDPKDRLVRKNRGKYSSKKCRSEEQGSIVDIMGVDLDANWGVDFGNGQTVSRQPCTDFYAGPKAFSEPETRALRDAVLAEENKGILAHLDVHNYLQIVVAPWDHKKDKPERVKEVDEVGDAIASAMSRVNGTRYMVSGGLKERRQRMISGTMLDWVFSQGILSYRVQLRPDTGAHLPFQLHTKEILPACKEGAAAAVEAVKYAQRKEVEGASGGSNSTSGGSYTESEMGGEGAIEGGSRDSGNRTTVLAVGVVVGVLALVTIMGIVWTVLRRQRSKRYDEMLDAASAIREDGVGASGWS